MGQGKELIAGALHSLRAAAVKIIIYASICAAIPRGSLFGKRIDLGMNAARFTGAVRQKLGRVEEAHTGTIFPG